MGLRDPGLLRCFGLRSPIPHYQLSTTLFFRRMIFICLRVIIVISTVSYRELRIEIVSRQVQDLPRWLHLG